MIVHVALYGFCFTHSDTIIFALFKYISNLSLVIKVSLHTYYISFFLSFFLSLSLSSQ